MKAVVLAAGEGRRLRPLTSTMSKGMIPVGNIPIIEHAIRALASCDVRDIVVIVGYQKEKIMNLLGDGTDLGVNIKYVTQRFQLGTAHALFQAKAKLSDRFMVVPGDSLIEPEGIKALLTIPEGEWGLLAASTANSSKYGLVETKDDKLTTIREKTKVTEDLISTGAPSIFALALWEYSDPLGPSLVNTGTYMLDTEILDMIEAKGLGEPQTLVSCLNEAARSKTIRVRITSHWLDAVYPFDVLDINEHILSKAVKDFEGRIEPGVVIKGPVEMGPEVRVRANTVLEGPIRIGGSTTIGPCAYIGPNTSIGENCGIGPMSVVKGSLLMDDVIVGSHCMISNTVIANGCSISDFFGVERGEYTIKLERHTFTKRLGACVGPDCAISHHVSLGPGVILGSGCRVGPMRALRDNLPDGTNAI
jgi:NDP-sugar pyrophosphorylase family protein